MILEKTITIQPPPYTDNNNVLINPKPLIFTSLNVSYIDNPSSKTVFAQIQHIPLRILLIDPNEYDAIGDYTQAQIENIFKSKLGDDIALTLRSLFPKTLEEDPSGPGSILAQMFNKLGIKSSPTCSCKKHALEMNTNGIEWCENNIPVIMGWLKQESIKRKIPFIESLATIVVKRAINKSKKLKNII